MKLILFYNKNKEKKILQIVINKNKINLKSYSLSSSKSPLTLPVVRDKLSS